MELRTLNNHGRVSFELGPQPVAISRLHVLDSNAETMWDLVPMSLKSIPVLSADMAFVELPQGSARAVLEALKEAAHDFNEAGVLSEQTATDAIRALSDLIGARQQAGGLSEETAATALGALRELSQSWKEVGRVHGQAATQQRKPDESGDRSDRPPVSRVVYGEVPDGYRQVQEPRPLTPGEKYCVVVFGEEVFDLGRDFFVA
ncbi:MAG TPA: hypothetical protein VGX68_08610 [Thermoanaerobaculia bacterium]|nr:hypothetical protein [Thermoanaerobaculia bacterium]